jgi:Domain of unknown function (DUF222)/HNH endonuclease
MFDATPVDTAADLESIGLGQEPAPELPSMWPDEDAAVAAILAELDVDAYFADRRADRLPPDLDEWEPGPMLGGLLSAIEVSELSGHDRVLFLRAHQRMASHHQARMYEAMAAVSDTLAEELDDLAVTEEAAAAEIRTALRMTRRSAVHELGVAHDLRIRIPRVLESLRSGDIDSRRAFEFVRGTCHLPIPIAREVVDRLLEDARGWTTGQLAERIRRECLDVDPEGASDRQASGLESRRVVAHPEPDGTVEVVGVGLPPDRACEAMNRINRIARRLHTSTESRTMDQLRADVMLDLLCGTANHDVSGTVHLTVDLETLCGLADHPGDLAGYGPVVADLARQAAGALAGGTWEYGITDPSNEHHLHLGTTRRRPSARQRRAVRARHPVCVFPGCRVPAVASDLDHRLPWSEGGTTTEDNLAPLCRADHCLRHQAGWSYTPGDGGDHRWVSPLGHTYTASGRDP